MDNLAEQITRQRLSGNEPLPEGATLLNFWQWMGSDLISNTIRGVLGEYLVALAVGAADGVRENWESYDVGSPGGIKIEVKTSAYIQSWYQSELYRPDFDIAPKRGWNAKTNLLTKEKKRWSDVYVFCLHHHQARRTANPLDLSQWTFYILPTATLDRDLPYQKKIRSTVLANIGAEKAHFSGLRQSIIDAYNAGKYTSNLDTEL